MYKLNLFLNKNLHPSIRFAAGWDVVNENRGWFPSKELEAIANIKSVGGSYASALPSIAIIIIGQNGVRDGVDNSQHIDLIYKIRHNYLTDTYVRELADYWIKRLRSGDGE